MASSIQKRNRGEIKIGTINICGMSNRSRFVLDKYADVEEFDVLVVQETLNDNVGEISLNNMSTITDSNFSVNRGAALYIRDNHSITKINEISHNFRDIDSCWGLAIINGSRYIIGTVYIKLASSQGISDVLSMLVMANKFSTKLKAKGVILVGDMNARHPSWGDSVGPDVFTIFLKKFIYIAVYFRG